MRLRLILPSVLAALALVPAAGATTYYVSPTGNDTNPGTTQQAPWQTLNRVNHQPLQPGDQVLLQGGATFPETLTPTGSGTPTNPITLDSYGTGKATLAGSPDGGIWLISQSNLTIQNLTLANTTQAISASANGTGVRNLTLRNLTLADNNIAINSANHADADWTIEQNQISRTQDSALIIFGSNFLITNNTITDSGLSTTITYDKHGIYAKGPGAHITNNTITNFQEDGISIRYPNALVENNHITGGPIGVGYFQYSNDTGRTIIRNNTLTATTTGIYLDPSTVETFLIHDNQITAPDRPGINAKTVPALYIWANTITANPQITTTNPYQTTPPADYTTGTQPQPTPAPTTTPDTTAPSVTITSPAPGAVVPLTTTVSASASDTSGITKVAFYVDGRIACTDTTAAYSCTVKLRAGSHAIRVEATDAAGNMGSVSISVTASRRAR